MKCGTKIFLILLLTLSTGCNSMQRNKEVESIDKLSEKISDNVKGALVTTYHHDLSLKNKNDNIKIYAVFSSEGSEKIYNFVDNSKIVVERELIIIISENEKNKKEKIITLINNGLKYEQIITFKGAYDQINKDRLDYHEKLSKGKNTLVSFNQNTGGILENVTVYIEVY